MRQFGTILGLVGRLLFGPAVRDLRQQLHRSVQINKSTMRALAPLFVEALVLAEDRRFFWHGGVDLIAICRAAWKNIFHGRLEGASTIEQRLVRRLTGRCERTLRRKISEVFLAANVTQVIPKEEIPALYLATAYFGWRANGIAEACKRHRVNLSNPTPSEAAGLVARIAYPEPQRASKELLERIERRRAHLAARRVDSSRAVRYRARPETSSSAP